MKLRKRERLLGECLMNKTGGRRQRTCGTFGNNGGGGGRRERWRGCVRAGARCLLLKRTVFLEILNFGPCSTPSDLKRNQ